MAGTTKMIAVHQITLKPDGKKQRIIKPHPTKPFDCPNDDLDFLREAGAVKDYETEVVEDDDDEDDDEPDQAEVERLALVDEAKKLKIKGIRKDMSTDTLREKITEAKGADDDSEEDVL